MDFARVLLYIRIFFCRIWRNFFGPVIEVTMNEVVDRLGNNILEHELLVMFHHTTAEESVAFYQDYNKKMKIIQDGEWLRRFLGQPKDIPYWVTPWGESLKPYREKHLSLLYAEQYVQKLKDVWHLLKKEGYRPERYGYITGELLLDERGGRKFIIWNGHRRALSLAALGLQKKIRVEVSGGDRWNGNIESHVVRIEDLLQWKNVRNGMYTPEEARAFFGHFFS